MQRENGATWGVGFLLGFTTQALELASRDVYISIDNNLVVAGPEEKDNPNFRHVGMPKISTGLLFDLSTVCRDIFTSMEAVGIEPGSIGDECSLGIHAAHYLVTGKWSESGTNETINTAIAEACDRIHLSYDPVENVFVMDVLCSDGVIFRKNI